ncbi:hypothetical protein SAMN05216262_12515 [Colwellia chukchiensis]|uniref:Swiss Army Knife 2H phosphoesterase domain-containing protein n=2 Tax=Colwellia chukchiensis TaxID=641665 RepID=A0A1H7TFP2_9GAMM|nr:hypothetical protein SAMN05216262_12515 [Colwellia chukchiensis]
MLIPLLIKIPQLSATVAILFMMTGLHWLMAKPATASQAVVALPEQLLLAKHTIALSNAQQSDDWSTTKTESAKKENLSPLARAMAQKQHLPADSPQADKTLTLDIIELEDSTGLRYLGGTVPAAELSLYLTQLKTQLGAEQFALYRSHQAMRDHHSFHVTLINPYEYQTVNKDRLKMFTKFQVHLYGLGRVGKGDKTSYFVVASSSEGQYIRQNVLLKPKDFHVTLGFYPEDIYGVSKGIETLIKSVKPFD